MRLARPSVRPFVFLSGMGSNRKTTKRRRIKIGIQVPHGTSKWNANFHWKSQRSRSQDVKHPKSGVMLTYRYGRQRRRIKRSRRRLQTRPTASLGLTIVRHRVVQKLSNKVIVNDSSTSLHYSVKYILMSALNTNIRSSVATSSRSGGMLTLLVLQMYC